jgi:glycosyltransferase involved in cell wall biosynthesis
VTGRRHTVLEGLMFFPRGGSAHVVRSLARTLPAHGWDAPILSGSLPGRDGDAGRFFAGLDVTTVDFDRAAEAPDPLAADPPFHPSYEDRPGAPDRVFAMLDDAQAEHQVQAWARALVRAGAGRADVLHLHHLTPLHEAARRVAAHVPVVGHLHGTELLMLEAIARGAPRGWAHAEAWRHRMEAWARRCARLVLLSEGQRERALDLLDVDPARCLVLPNGFDPTCFAPRDVDRGELWHQHLVEHPRGWRPGADAGSISYTDEDIAPLTTGDPILLYVGRFTEVKRVDLLIRAFADARRGGLAAALVIVGGHPGEWEGDHPAEVIDETGAEAVYLAGWHEHDDLPDLLAGADALVLPSVREQFGQVIVEAMACGRPPIAVDAHGPAEIIEDGVTGWLVPPDDEAALGAAIAEAAGDPAERTRRGAGARRIARARYAWPALAGRLAATLDEVAGEGPEGAREAGLPARAGG